MAERLEPNDMPIQAVVDRARKLLGLHGAALDEAVTLGPILSRVFETAATEIQHPGYRRVVAGFLDRYLKFHQLLGESYDALTTKLSLVQDAFEKLQPEAQSLPRMNHHVPENSGLLFEAALEQNFLRAQLEGMSRRRDIALNLLGSPAVVALVGMNDAGYILIGQRSRYAVDVGELVGDLLEAIGDLYVPGTGIVAVILRQLRNRMDEAAQRTAEGVVLAERLYLFGDRAASSLAMLDEWRRAADAALDDLLRIGRSELPEVLRRVRELGEMPPSK